jgi:uncharacterized protein YyaL (SSP411 family)
VLERAYRPTTLTLFVPASAQGLPEVLAKPLAQGVQAWVCEGLACRAPIASAHDLREALASARIAGASPPHSARTEGATP